MSNKIELISQISKQCSQEQLDSILSPLRDLPNGTSTKAEIISACLNKELGAYGFESYPSNDGTMVLVDDETMCQIVDFLSERGFRPHFTKEQINRLKNLQKISSENKIDIYWAQSGLKKKYYYLKQYGFNGAQLYNLLNKNKANAATAALSATGAASIDILTIIAISWSASLCLSTVENLIPSSMVRTKATVSAAKFLLAIPIRCAEATSNQIFGFVENIVIGSPLPTNVTQVYKLEVGPKLANLPKIKKPAIEFIIKQLEKVK